MKQKLIRVALPALVLAVLVAACDQPSGGGGGGGGGTPTPTTGGTLTVQNATASGSVIICDSATTPTTQMATASLIASPIAVGQANSATSYKLTGTSADTFTDTASFTKTGNLLVVLTIGTENHFKVVSFTNGSGTVDFRSMTKQSSLPAN